MTLADIKRSPSYQWSRVALVEISTQWFNQTTVSLIHHLMWLWERSPIGDASILPSAGSVCILKTTGDAIWYCMSHSKLWDVCEITLSRVLKKVVELHIQQVFREMEEVTGSRLYIESPSRITFGELRQLHSRLRSWNPRRIHKIKDRTIILRYPSRTWYYNIRK
jgi:hypothetical protein